MSASSESSAEESEHVGRLRARAANCLAPGRMAIDPARAARPVDEEFPADSVHRSPFELGEHGRAFGAVVSRGSQLAEGLLKRKIDVDTGTEAANGQTGPLDEVGQSPDELLVFVGPGDRAGHAVSALRSSQNEMKDEVTKGDCGSEDGSRRRDSDDTIEP